MGPGLLQFSEFGTTGKPKAWVSKDTAPFEVLYRVSQAELTSSSNFYVCGSHRFEVRSPWKGSGWIKEVANPLLGRLRRFVRGVLERRGWMVPQPRGYLYSCKNFETAFRNHRLAILHARGIGFGPLSLMGLHLSETFGHKLNSGLQKAADTRMPFLQSVARDYVAVACKVETERPRSQ